MADGGVVCFEELLEGLRGAALALVCAWVVDLEAAGEEAAAEGVLGAIVGVRWCGGEVWRWFNGEDGLGLEIRGRWIEDSSQESGRFRWGGREVSSSITLRNTVRF